MKTARELAYRPTLPVRLVVMWLVLPVCGAGMAQELKSPPVQGEPALPETSDAAGLVKQLGASSFTERRAAEDGLLALGLASEAALLNGLESTDLHVRRTSRRLLDEVLDADLRKRLEALLADRDGTGQHDLPGWRQFQESVGNDPEARKLYAEMLKSEEGLLESFATGGEVAAEAFRLRVRQVRSQVYSRSTQKRKLPELSTLAAITFVACDPRARGTATSELSNTLSLYQRKEFADQLKKGKSNDAVRRILGNLILSSSDLRLSRQSLQLAVTLQMNDPGLRLALRLLEDADGQQQTSVAGAIGVVGLLGGEEFTKAIVPLLDDERICGTRIQNGQRLSTLVQDVAAAWLVKLTDQRLEDYGLAAASRWFNSVRSNPATCFSVTSVRFAEEGDRKKCLDKLRAWLADHPQPGFDLEPAPKADAAKPQAGNQVVAKQTKPDRLEVDEREQMVVLADYSVARQLRSVRERVAEKDFAQVATILGEILASEQDSLYQPNRGSGVFRSVKAEAASILNALPREGLDEYEFRFGPVARHHLDKALDAGDMQAVADVERRYLFTEAGRQAAYLLAFYHRGRGELWSAAVYLQRLKHVALLNEEQRALLSLELAVCWLFAGRSDAVRSELLAWKRQWPHRSVQLGGNDVKVFADGDDPYEWLRMAVSAGQRSSRDWIVSRGDISGTRQCAGGALWPEAKPLLAMTEDSLLEKILTEMGDERRQRRVGAVSTLESLVIGELLIQRTPTELKAVDRTTGQLHWQYPMENALEHILRVDDAERRDRFADAIRNGLERRLWDDCSWGALSSNGHLVFAVEDLGFDLGVDYQRVATRMDGTRQLDASAYGRANAISAYDVRTGKLAWQIGEVFGESSPELRDGTFLGPPLPLGDRLYAVVDFPEDTRLMMLDAAGGAIARQWILQVRERTPQLPTSATSIVGPPPPVRSAPPVFADGVLVCSTPDGTFAAVDVIDGTTLWTYEADRKPAPRKGFNIQFQIMMGRPKSETIDRWAATTATIAQDRVLLTNSSLDELHCVELRTGQRVWKSWCREGLYVGGHAEGTIVVVGRSGLRGIRLDDGDPAWSKDVSPFPGGTVPAGRGYLSEGLYHVPLTSGEVVTFDVQTGRLAGTIRPPGAVRLGNLVPTGEMVVSVGLLGTERFSLLSQQRAKLDATQTGDVDSPELARIRARLALATGETEHAIDLLIEARHLGEDRESDELLLDAVLQGFNQQPDRYVNRIDFIDALLRTVPDKTNDWLALAESLTESGRPLKALDIYSSLMDKGELLDQVQPVSASRTIRLDRRMAYGLEQLRTVTNGAHAEEVGSRIRAMLASATAIDELHRFGNQPEAAANSLRLAEHYLGKQGWIEADILLRAAMNRSTSVERNEAIHQVGSLLETANRPRDADYWRATRATSVTVDDGDGAEWAAIARYRSPWADSAVETSDRAVSNRSASDPLRIGRQTPVFLDSPDGQYALELSATYEARSRMLTGLDRWGRRRFQIELPQSTGKGGVVVNPSIAWMHGVRVGHLLVLYRGDMVAAIDCLAEEPKLLWSTASGAQTSSSSIHFAMMGAVGNRLLGGQASGPGAYSRGVAATSQYVCFQRGRELNAVDPFTGQLLWSRDDLPAGCDLVGDRERIFATPPNDEPTSVFRAIDGKLLDRRPAVPRSERFAVLGGLTLRWERDAKPPCCGLFDPWHQRYVWQRELAAESLLAVAGNTTVGIVDPTGAVTLLDVAGGAEMLSSKIEPPKALDGVALLQFDDAFVLAVNVPEENDAGRVIAMQPFAGGRPINGKLFGLDSASGNVLWSLPIANQQLRLDQPSGIPVLVACNRYQKRVKLKNNSYRHESPKLLLKIIDCRDGQVFHESEAKNAYWPNYNLSTDLEARKAMIEVSDRIIELKFAAEGE